MRFKLSILAGLALIFGTGVGIYATRPVKKPILVGQSFGALSDDALLALARSGGDCTAELTARIEALRPHGGIVNLPNGGASYRIPGGLVLGGNVNPTGQGPPVSLFGPPGAATLAYDGNPATPALRIDRMWAYGLRGIGVYRTPSDRQGVGIEVAPDPASGVPLGSGTVSGTALWSQVQTRFFAVGAQLGTQNRGIATSEIQFDSCVFGNNDIGVRIDDFNTLDFTFNMLNMSANRIGLLAGSGGVVSVDGGSASGNEEFDFQHLHAHPMTIRAFRSEHTNCFYSGVGTVVPTNATIDSCLIYQRANPTRPAISTGWGCELIVRNTTILGGDGLGNPGNSGIFYVNNSGHSNIIIENCGIRSPVPITLVSQTSDTPPVKLIVRNCWQISETGEFVKHFDNYEGLTAIYPLASPPAAAQTVDDGDAGWSAPGWPRAQGPGFEAYYGGDTAYQNAGATAAGPSTWVSGSYPAGRYRILATWTGYPNRATNASYTVKAGATVLRSVVASQVATPTDRVIGASGFKDLGVVELTAAGPITVELSGQGNGAVIADAVRFEPTTDPVTPPQAISQFKIDLRFDATVPDAHRGVIRQAADRWQRCIVGSLPDARFLGYGPYPAADVDDILIDVSTPYIDGPGQVLGNAGPDSYRPDTFLPYHGTIRIDSADASGLYASGMLYHTAFHEIGHCLGFGTLWAYKPGLKSGFFFTGANAVSVYGGPVPLETTGGPGTAGSHWSEAVFGTEAMTGYLNNGVANPVSRLTIASMADLGYAVDLNAAD